MKVLKITNKILACLVFVALFSLLFGITYSYFTAQISGSETNTTLTVEAGDMAINFNGGPAITANDIAPSTSAFATKTFTVTGTKTTNEDMGYKLILVIEENTFSNNAISYTLTGTNTSSNGIVVPNITTRVGVGTENNEIGTGSFSGATTSAVHTYEMKFYFYVTNEDQLADMNKTFRSHIEISGHNPAENRLGNKIIAVNGGMVAIMAKGTAHDFSDPASLGSSGVYAAPDEYGTSYYFRGHKSALNNNVLFAGFQWKIVRVNGDGSVRIIYNGTEAQYIANTNQMNITGTNLRIGAERYNNYSNDNKYLGYMYGSSSVAASDAQTNTNNSTIKAYVDNWYQNNILNQGTAITNKLSDNLFCNDRSISDGTGAGNTATTYKSYVRNFVEYKPTLMCEQKNDRFTVNDEIKGNGSLTYPIGLITADELAYSGLTSRYGDLNQYLSNSSFGWSLSPLGLQGNTALIVPFDTELYISAGYGVTENFDVRPVLNIAANVMITSGDGSSANPYRV